MSVSIKQHFKHQPAQESIELKRAFQAVRDEFDALYAKMDTDFTAQNAAVTSSQLDVDYASTLSGPYLTD